MSVPFPGMQAGSAMTGQQLQSYYAAMAQQQAQQAQQLQLQAQLTGSTAYGGVYGQAQAQAAMYGQQMYPQTAYGQHYAQVISSYPSDTICARAELELLSVPQLEF